MTRLNPAQTYLDGVDREWERLGRPGTWLTGEERVGVATVAREARAEVDWGDHGLPGVVAAAARRVSAQPATIRPDWIDANLAAGLGHLTYVEIVGIVARLAAVDTFLLGIGWPERPLPPAQPGEPSRQVVDEATITDSAVPMVGTGAPGSLTAVAAESEAQFDLHGALYLSIDEMGDMDISKDLHRTQMELVAARTSRLNDCFY
ncbi:MAG: hypothetical protein GY698_06855 [Actinomycetia bacterium]|nr:hypothetical protein [Actinomycetes bacterium]